MTDLCLPGVIGHRGIARDAPENTLAGFSLAAAKGVDWIELDVQLTSDGVPVVFHDDRLERTSNGRGRLTETPFADLLRLDAGRWFSDRFAGERIPEFGDVLDRLVGLGLGLCLEIKADEERGAATASAALDLLVRRWPAGGRVPLLSSFAQSALAVMAGRAPDWPRGLLVPDLSGEWRGDVRRLGCRSLHVDHRALDERQVAAVKAEGLALLAYTVNDRSRAEQLWGWGVDALFSDCPDALLERPDR